MLSAPLFVASLLLFVVAIDGQEGVGTACTAYGVAGTCQVGNACEGNWFSSVAGVVSGCGAFANNVRCCVPACAGDNSLPGVCAASCTQASLPNFASSGQSVCPQGATCCTPNDLSAQVAQAAQLQNRVNLPGRLQVGDTIMIVAPSSATPLTPQTLPPLVASVFGPMGLKVVYGANVYATDDLGRVAGTDEQRAADMMTAFTSKTVKAIVAVGGGWGCARMIDLLDYSVIRANPKPLLGYSDVSACIAAIVWRAGITSFVGPMMGSDWTNGNGNFARRALMSPLPFAMTSFAGQTTTTVVSGKAAGRLVGGNLSVLSAMIGAKTPVFPAEGERLILILEDVGEEMYRVDRLLSTMQLNGFLDRVDGFVWGTCFNCVGRGDVSTVVRRAMLKLNKPSVIGVSFGHHGEQFTVPIGQEAVLDADRRQLFLIRAATQANTPTLSSYVARTECGPTTNPAAPANPVANVPGSCPAPVPCVCAVAPTCPMCVMSDASIETPLLAAAIVLVSLSSQLT
jgi:muramoyltetrapeptide carboxypeptidase